MQTDLYTVLRTTRQPTDGTRGNSLGEGDGASDAPVLSTHDFDEQTAAEARADPGLKIARGFAMKLVDPVQASPAPSAPSDWGLEAVGATSSGMTGSGVVVAVLDTGIDRDHEAFSNTRILEKDFSRSATGDRHGHGTHCAGTIFGSDVGGHRIGVAPGVRQALIGKILDDTGRGETPWMFEGIRWALANGADVISMSIGFDFPGQVAKKVRNGWEAELATSEALDAFRENLDMLNALMAEITANKAFGTSPLVVAASGNESRRTTRPDWRVSASLPSSAVHLSVAALERSGDDFGIASFSNSKPKVSAPGVDIVSASIKGGLVADSGTSMACPFVAGVAALWAERLRQEGDPVDARTLESHVVASASRKRLVGCDVADVGRGLVCAPQ